MNTPFVGTILYDDACGFCRRWVPFWGSTLRRRGFEIAPLQSPWVSHQLGLAPAELLDDIRLLRPNGEHLHGADVYRFVMRRIWWAYPLFLLARAPGLSLVFNHAYRRFARGRYQFSRTCGLNPGTSDNVAPFLTAEWRSLLMINYAVDPALLLPQLPFGTELDSYDGATYLSVVGFRFLHTRVRGCAVPGHRSFEEVNLRFYVRRRAAEGWRRGVVFLKELVPRGVIAAIARRVYHEPYEAVPMSHHREPADGELRPGVKLRYQWRYDRRWHALSATIASPPQPIEPQSHEAFIMEHYWGYTRRRDGTTHEYQVAHPPWRAAAVTSARLDCDVAVVYGPAFREALTAAAASAFVADGSPVTVFRGVPLTAHVAGA